MLNNNKLQFPIYPLLVERIAILPPSPPLPPLNLNPS